MRPWLFRAFGSCYALHRAESSEYVLGVNTNEVISHSWFPITCCDVGSHVQSILGTSRDLYEAESRVRQERSIAHTPMIRVTSRTVGTLAVLSIRQELEQHGDQAMHGSTLRMFHVCVTAPPLVALVSLLVPLSLTWLTV